MIAAGPFLLAIIRDHAWCTHGVIDHPCHAPTPSWRWSVPHGCAHVEKCDHIPRCRRLCSSTLGSGRRGSPSEHSRVNWSQLIIGHLLLATVVRRLPKTSKENDADRLNAQYQYRSSYCTVAVTMQHHHSHFWTSNKIQIVANELCMFKKPNLTSLLPSLYFSLISIQLNDFIMSCHSQPNYNTYITSAQQ